MSHDHVQQEKSICACKFTNTRTVLKFTLYPLNKVTSLEIFYSSTVFTYSLSLYCIGGVRIYTCYNIHTVYVKLCFPTDQFYPNTVQSINFKNFRIQKPCIIYESDTYRVEFVPIVQST